MAARSASNNLKAGFFLIFALILFVVMAVVFSDASDKWLTRRKAYVFRFDIATGAMGLTKDSMIKIGGQPAGYVERVDFRRPKDAKEPTPAKGSITPPAAGPAGEPAQWIYVVAKIRADLPLYADAKIHLELPLLGTVSTLNIPDVGYSDSNSKPLEEWAVLTGVLAPPAFLAQAGYGPDQKSELQTILERGKEISVQVSDMVHTFNDRLAPALDSAQQTVNNVRDLSGEFAQRRRTWADLVTTSLANVQTATEQARDRVIELKAIESLVKDTIERNRPFIDRIFFAAAEATETVNVQLKTTVTQTLADASKAVANVMDLTERARPVVNEAVPELRKTMANARLASDQLKLALVEIRRTPWRLLYQPTRKEIEEELMYDRVRTYAAAVSDLRATSEALTSALEGSGSGGKAPMDRNQISAMTKEMGEAFERYRQAEKQFLDKLLSDKP